MFFFFQAEDGIRDRDVTGVQTCASDLAFLVTSISMFGMVISPPIISLAKSIVPAHVVKVRSEGVV